MAAGTPMVGSAPVTGDQVIADTSSWAGTPYGWGREAKQIAVDCSGLVQGVFADLGIKLPRTSYTQASAGTAVPSLSQAVPGDLIFFDTGEGANSHVGIYAGNNMMWDAPHTGTSVGLHSISGYGAITAIRRIVPPGSMSAAGQQPMYGTGPNYVSNSQQLAQASQTNAPPPQQGIYQESCLLSLPGLSTPLGKLGGNCVFSTSNARAFLGAGLLISGALLSAVGFALVTAALLGKNPATVASALPGPVGAVGKIASATGRDRTRQRERPDREPPLGEQDISDLDQGLAAKRQEAEGPSEGELQFRRESRARRRASRPGRAA